jgi:hypothetical protein
MKVFISYSRRDLEFVRRLYAYLNALGQVPTSAATRFLDVWFDKRRILPTRDFRVEIEKGIEASRMILLVISPDSMKSEYVKNEFNLAREHGLTIFPLLHRDVDANRLDENQRRFYEVVTSYHYITLRDEVASWNPELEATLHRHWMQRLFGQSDDSLGELRILRRLYCARKHHWVVPYLDYAVRQLMPAYRQDRAQHYVHTMKCIADEQRQWKPTLDDLMAWCAAALPEIHRITLALALQKPCPPTDCPPKD